jgi:hypothetical protein
MPGSFDSRHRVESSDEERRVQRRYRDGAPTHFQHQGGRWSPARIVDVSSTGIRLFSAACVSQQERVFVRVDFVQSSFHLGFKVMWRRPVAGGYEYGARHAPVVPGTEYLLDNYRLRVLNRAG